MKDIKQNIKSRSVNIIKEKRKIIALVLTSIILISFWYSSPISKFEFRIRTFNTFSGNSIVRTGEDVQFNWEIQGVPYQAMIIFGDGNVKLIDNPSPINGICSGNIIHSYALQGKYRPTLRIWDYWGKIFVKSLELEVRNDPPLFNVLINGIETDQTEHLRLSENEQVIEVFEDEEVIISIENEVLSLNNLTFIFDYGTTKTKTKLNSTTYSWHKKGVYPLIITAIGSQGELEQQIRYINVKNKAPIANFSLDYEYIDDHIITIKVNASLSKDTKSDYNSLRYYWDWGDGTTDWGKYAHHSFPDPGEYNITLWVRDNDGFYDVCSKMFIIDNTIPVVNLFGSNANITLYEGQEITFNAQGCDNSQNVVRLHYYWNFNSSLYNPEDLSNYELGGWINDHVFYDDFHGFVTSVIVDPQGLYDLDSLNVEILNVAPNLTIYGASIASNVTFGLYRSNLSSDLNFTFRLNNGKDKSYERMINFTNETTPYVYSEKAQLNFDILDNWIITVNSSQKIPQNEEYQAILIFEFLDGQKLMLTSDVLETGEWGYFEDNLTCYFYDQENFTFKYPISIEIELFDPSIDDIYCTINHTERKSLEISTTSEFPTIDEIYIGDIHYKFRFYQEDGKKFVNITATRLIESILFNNNSFPVRLEFSAKILPLVNVKGLLEDILNLTNLVVEDCLDSINMLEVHGVDDDQGSDTKRLVIKSTNTLETVNLTPRIDTGVSTSRIPHPYGRIGSFLETVYEEEKVKFTVKSNEEYADLKDLIYMWNFSDGSYSYKRNTEHSWKKAGIYNITLIIADRYGNTFIDVSTIEVLSKAPEIIGPYSFQGLEGQAITLDVEVYDTSIDDYKLNYEWYDEKDTLISKEKSPTLILDDGKYSYRFVVKDPDGKEVSAIIAVVVHPLSPNLYVSNYMYHGAAADLTNPYDTTGELTLRAYAYDTLYDTEHIDYYWTIRDGKQIYTFHQEAKQYSEIKFKCSRSTIYQGQVKAVDQDGKTKVLTFQIYSTIDETFDGISDEMNEMLKTSSTDTDGDHLTDEYEIYTSFTNYTNPDTDDDLLYDGYDDYNVGEQPLNTDPLDWDTDDDYLGDGREYYGWNITIVYFENTTKFLVNSDPLDNDTDNDGLSDYAEYCAGSHPRMEDSDNDGLNDDEDPNPASWDGDNDALSDLWEIAHGTDPLKSDSDGDGLKDGDEVYGWGNGFNTNPLDADSDHDFAADGAEIRNYLIKLQAEEYDDMDQRVTLSAPVSLDFSHHFTQAAAAQISFGVAYGEYGENATGSYGIQDEQVYNLTIGVTKVDDGVLLGCYNTNGSRYFSQVMDITDIMNNETLNYDYYGEYQISILDANGIPLNTGDFPATFSFANDTIGQPPSGWSYSSLSGENKLEIVEGLGDHDMIYWMRKKTSTSKVETWVTFDSNATSGTIEFWLQKNTNTAYDPTRIYLGGDGGGIKFGMQQGQLYIGSWSTSPTYVGPFTKNEWHHVRVDFNVAQGWQIQIDDTWYGSGYNYTFTNSPTNINSYDMSSIYSGDNPDYSVWLDALGYSWDDNYDIGDNKYDYIETGCYLEYFDLSFSRYLDPNDSDFDDDGIMDGVEMGLLVEGNNTINYKDTYDLPYSVGNETAWWPFEEAEGSKTFDICEDNMEGTIYGATWTDGLVGTFALDFDGANDYVSIADNDKLDLLDAWTTCAWIKRDAMNVQHSILEKYDWLENRGTFAVRITSDNKLTAYHISGTSSDTVKSTTIINTNGWYFLTATYNSSINTLKVYINGELENVNSAASKPDYLSYGYLYIGARGNDHATSFNGIIDDVRIYNRSLKGEEIGSLYNNTKGLLISNNASTIVNSGAGHYPGTYSFENDEDNSFPDGWSSWCSANCEAKVISSIDGHNKVLQMYDNSGSGYAYIYQTITTQTSGTAEVWMRITDANKETYLDLASSGGQVLAEVSIEAGLIKTKTGYTSRTLSSASSNTWYHVRIDFRCTGGAEYMGLSQKQYRVYINDVEYGPYSIAYTYSVARCMISTHYSHSGYSAYYDAIGYSWDPNYYVGDNLNDGALTIEAPQEFQVEIPQIGIVYGSSLAIHVTSLHNTDGSGRIGFRLIKDELNQTLVDPIIYEYYAEFDVNEAFSYETVLDLSMFYTSGKITEIYGKYILQIKVVSTNLTDCFSLLSYEIETETFIEAGFDDSEAWITDPGEEDSDFDGWDDHREIFTEETNPVSKDMDGDESWDPKDRDPYGDLMLDIHPYYSAFRNIPWNEFSVWMQIAITFMMGDDEYYFNTPDAQANTEYTYDPPWGYKYHAVYYDNLHYYVNIDDDIDRQDDNITMGLKLWWRRWGLGFDPPWDILAVDGSDMYTIGTPGDDYVTLHAEHIGAFDGLNELDVKVKPITVDRANTIAVYEAGGTFNGHYNEKEQRFNLIQLHVLGESYYPGTYNFQQNLEEWTDESGTDCSANCTGTYQNHSGVVHLNDASDNVVKMQLQLSPAKSNDIEFWVYPDTSCHSVFTLWSGGTRILYIQFLASSDTIRCRVGENYYTILSGYTEKWYHIRLDLNFGTKKWNCYVDQVLKLSNINFESTQVGNYNKMIYETWSSGDYSQGDTYLDSVGLIGYNGYAQGDNLDTYSCDGTPFVEGTNVIVIPTSLFTRTELHHYIENDQLEQTVLYSDEEGLFEMIANERNGESDVGCADVDYVFIRYDISPDEAMAVLNMVLQGLIEETLDENNNTMYINGTINEYLSSKLDGIRATLLNLPYASLGYIPWVMSYFNSPMGPQPHPADPLGIFIWLITWLIPILHVIIFVIVNMLASDSTGFILDFAKAIFMRLLTALGDLLWLIIRTAILIMIFILVALIYFSMFLNYISIIPIVLMIANGFCNVDCSMNFFYFEIVKNNETLRVEDRIDWIYNEFLDLSIPCYISESKINEESINNFFVNIIFNDCLFDMGESLPLGDALLGEGYSAEEDFDINTFNYIIGIFFTFSILIPLAGFLIGMIFKGPYQIIGTFLALAVAITGVILAIWILSVIPTENDVYFTFPLYPFVNCHSASAKIAIIIALLSFGLTFFITSGVGLIDDMKMGNLAKVISLISLILNIIKVLVIDRFIPESDLLGVIFLTATLNFIAFMSLLWLDKILENGGNRTIQWIAMFYGQALISILAISELLFRI